MLDIKFIKEHKQEVIKNCHNRNISVNIENLLSLYEEKKTILNEVENLKSERNKKSKTKPSPAEIEKIRKNNEKIKKLELLYGNIDEKFKDLLWRVPNMTHPDSPIGEEKDFKILKKKGEPKKFGFKAKDHLEIMTDLDMVDFERGTKVSGSKFYFYKNEAVAMNQALINYGLKIVKKHGYSLMETPVLVKDKILEGSGFNPRGEEKQTYKIEGEDLNLIGTAEIPALGYYANEILDLNKGPIKYAALSDCFRTEAGAYGKESRGLYRVHQFKKLELFIFCKPEDSEKLHKELLDIEQKIIDALKIPYRVIDIPSGDLGGPAYKKYDIEAWIPSKNDYGEITSCSNCTDYQARRLNIKYKKADGTNDFVHTLNGTAIVLSRFPLVIVENYQQKDGSLKFTPELKKIYGFQSVKPRE